jgi:uncharacterized protein
MSISMHAASAPIQIRMLGNLAHWLERAQAHAEAKKFESTNYLTLRLAPDMLPFVSQVRVASDIARLPATQTTKQACRPWASGSPRASRS